MYKIWFYQVALMEYKRVGATYITITLLRSWFCSFCFLSDSQRPSFVFIHFLKRLPRCSNPTSAIAVSFKFVWIPSAESGLYCSLAQHSPGWTPAQVIISRALSDFSPPAAFGEVILPFLFRTASSHCGCWEQMGHVFWRGCALCIGVNQHLLQGDWKYCHSCLSLSFEHYFKWTVVTQSRSWRTKVWFRSICCYYLNVESSASNLLFWIWPRFVQ